uniref:Secreted protein n=1 Tax=Anguilla anguilla TaxID=7936 RepID=A0A0E9X483_ANGAN
MQFNSLFLLLVFFTLGSRGIVRDDDRRQEHCLITPIVLWKRQPTSLRVVLIFRFDASATAASASRPSPTARLRGRTGGEAQRHLGDVYVCVSVCVCVCVCVFVRSPSH